MTHATPPAFDLRDIPFSYYGSWFALSPVVGNARRAADVHLVSHQRGMHPILAFRCANARIEATPSRLSWITEAGRIDAAYESADTLRLRGSNASLEIAAAAPELTPFSGTYLYRDPVDGSHVFTSYETGRRYRITLLEGTIATRTGDQALGASPRALTTSTDWEIAVEEYQAARPAYTPTEPFPVVEKRAAAEFAAFADRIAPWRSADTPAAELAAYVLWSATVAPAGFLARPAVLMSKHWMDKVWSWDHCFNAIALVDGEPDLAWHQFSLPFDHQDPAGALPDSVAHSEVLYNYVKPPIHGWALGILRERLGRVAASEGSYRRLEQWTAYWLGRRAPGSPLPHYHHGNDSGWDNATTFDAARVIESADLSAFLVLQMRELAALAIDLGHADAAAHWNAEAATLLNAMLDLLWTGDRFAARIAETGAVHTSDSLLDAMPIILGELLPEHVSTALASRIERHMTNFGPATEPLDSPHYAADGYWRGPIWAPSTVLIEDGLRRAGHTRLADEISWRFRRLCETSGFAENFDAETGAGQRDLAYTWTASAYLILARDAQERSRALG